MAEAVVSTRIVAKDDTKTATASAARNFQTLGQKIDASNKKVSAGMRNFTRQGRAYAAQFGYQIQDIAVQIQGGQNAMMVMGQQGSQLASIFGSRGAVLGAIIAVGSAVASAFAPSFLTGARAVANLRENFEDLRDTLLDTGLEGFSEDVLRAMVRVETATLGDQWKELHKTQVELKDARSALVEAELREGRALNAKQAEVFAKARSEARATVDALVIDQAKQQKAYENTRLSLVRLDEALTASETGGKFIGNKQKEDAAKAFRDQEQAMDSAIRVREQYIDAQYRTAQALKANLDPMTKHLENIKNYKILLEEGWLTQEEFAKAVIKSGNLIAKANKTAAKETKSEWEKAMDAMQGSIEATITSAIMEFKSLSDVVNSIQNQIASTLVKQHIATPISGFISEAVGSAFAPAAPVAAIPAANTLGGGISRAAPRTLGRSMDGGQSVTVQQSYNITALAPAETARVIAGQADTIGKIAVQSVEKAVGRNGRRLTR